MRPWPTTVAVHGGPRAAAAEGLTGAHTRGRSGERGLIMSWGKGGGAPGGPHRGLRWLVRRRDEAGSGETWCGVSGGTKEWNQGQHKVR
jgi:hypothetical protein